MAGFLVDEDLPRSLAGRLRAAGIGAEDVREIGLRGQPDEAVLAHAVSRGFALLSGDMGFANLLRFPLQSHAGLVIARFPNEMPAASLSEMIAKALLSLSQSEIQGNLIILEPGRIRLRRKS